ncbi:hypothetical protein BH09MYX1_BH09MYX1_49070 [soil metagenome]
MSPKPPTAALLDAMSRGWVRVFLQTCALLLLVFAATPRSATAEGRDALSRARASVAGHVGAARLGESRPTHSIASHHDGSAFSTHELYTGKAELVEDDDLDDGFDASCDPDDAPLIPDGTRRARRSSLISLREAQADPSRFGAGSGRARGPPV